MSEIKYIQIRIVNHCNLNCKYCGSCCNVNEEHKYVDTAKFERDLKRLKHYLPRIESIKVLGGEPLLHPEIVKIMEIIRSYYPDSYLEIATNGLLLLQLSHATYKKFNELDVVVHISEYDPFYSIKDEALNVLDSNGTKYYLTPVGKFFINKKRKWSSDIKKSYDICKCRDCLDFSDGMLMRCSIAWGMLKLNRQFGCEFELVEGEDCLNLYDEVDVDTFMEKVCKPGHLCGYCVDTALKWMDWKAADNIIGLENYLTEE